jgi:uncharacterized protein YbjT (DUF2867 family)
MAVNKDKPVLLTGATGFIGSSLYPVLRQRGYDVLCASRSPEKARRKYPLRDWVKLDVHDPETVRKATQGCGAVFYLIHEMTQSGYEEREKEAAWNVREAAEQTEVERIVYLGGIDPDGPPSDHLRSRMETGRILREGSVPALELRASMIMGKGSSSWQIVRDLAARLPIMVLPSWTQSETQPVYVDDVLEALVSSLSIDDVDNEYYDLPGPDTLTVEDILRRTAQAMNNRPYNIRVPLLSPKLSSYWLRFVTRSNYHLARELVVGLRNDILAENDDYWQMIDYTDLVSFDDAVRLLLNQSQSRSFLARLYEKGVSRLSRLGNK